MYSEDFVVFAIEYEAAITVERADGGLTLFTFFDEIDRIAKTDQCQDSEND